MRWRTEATRIVLGPAGILVDEQPVVRTALSIASLGTALNALPLPAGSRVVVVIDDEWVRTLLLTLPAELTHSDEIRACATHRLRDTFGAELASWPQVWPVRASLPWRGARLQRHSNPLLVASLPPLLLQTIAGWTATHRLRLARLGTAWGETLAAVPACDRGVLAVFRGQRMTVGAWSDQRWLGWRSFLARDAEAAGTEALRWLATLSWPEGELALWHQGWQPESTLPDTWSAHGLPPRLPRRRKATFDFRGQLPGPSTPLRHKLLGLALLATLAASIWVSLPPPQADDTAVVGARSPSPRVATLEQSVPAAVVPAVAEGTPDETDGVQADATLDDTQAGLEIEEVAWPRVLGTFEQQGQRWLLYSSGQESASLRRGAIIDGRYRIDRVDADSVMLTDMHTLQRQQTVLEPAGDQP